MAPRHKMSRTRDTARLNKKLTGWTDCLKTMMLNDHNFAAKPSHHERSQRWTRNMDDVRGTDQFEQFEKGGLPDNRERKCVIIEDSRRYLGCQGYLEFAPAIRTAYFSEASGKRKNDTLDATDTRRAKMGIQEEFHLAIFEGKAKIEKNPWPRQFEKWTGRIVSQVALRCCL